MVQNELITKHVQTIMEVRAVQHSQMTTTDIFFIIIAEILWSIEHAQKQTVAFHYGVISYLTMCLFISFSLLFTVVFFGVTQNTNTGAIELLKHAMVPGQFVSQSHSLQPIVSLPPIT